MTNKKSVNKNKNKNKLSTLRGVGDYSESVNKISDSSKRLEAKIDHLEKSLVHTTPSKTKAASTVGRVLGNFMGQGDLGALAGESLAKYFGHGDYTVKQNSLMQGNSSAMPPKFGNAGRGTRVTEREYLGDIKSGILSGGSTIFDNVSYQINPTNVAMFPWLSRFAVLFDQWEPHGIVLEYVSTSSEYNGASQALGSVVMATDYDPYDAIYASKQVMENSDYACATKPSCSLVHGLECDPKERPSAVLYTSTTGGIPATSTTLGNFQISTTGCSAGGVTLGELWISYDITFYKKQIADPEPFLTCLGITNNTLTLSQVLGTISNNFITFNNDDSVHFNNKIFGERYIITIFVQNTTAYPGPVYVGFASTVSHSVSSVGSTMYICTGITTAADARIVLTVPAVNGTYSLDVVRVPTLMTYI